MGPEGIGQPYNRDYPNRAELMTAAVNLKALLGIDTVCPCGVGMLRTEIDHQRGYCDICHLTTHGTGFDYHAAARSDSRHEPNWGGDYGMPEHWWESDYE